MICIDCYCYQLSLPAIEQTEGVKPLLLRCGMERKQLNRGRGSAIIANDDNIIVGIPSSCVYLYGLRAIV